MKAILETDTRILRTALAGLILQRDSIAHMIATVEKQLNGAARPEPHAAEASSSGATAEKPKRRVSVAGKRRMAAAQKLRWIRFHEARAAEAAKTKRR